jgi:GNAT superfamily N-acetyltransferase
VRDERQTGEFIRPLGKPGDLGWVIMAHGEVYAAEFGWDSTLEALIAQIVADYAADHDPTREAAWIAEAGGRRVGCVFCVAAHDPQDTPSAATHAGDNPTRGRRRADGTTAQLRILLVHPDGRGHGLGGRLVDTCISFARTAGYAQLRLWTNDPLVAARRIYLQRGFVLTEQQPHHSFGVDLVGQTYQLDLRHTGAVAPIPGQGGAVAGDELG